MYMKKISLIIPAVLLLLMPLSASAHEHASYVIAGTTYNFVIGSQNEPIAVDDKTGLDLAVTKGVGRHTMGPDGDMDGPIVGTTPVTGLEETLKVELVAGKERKSIAIKPSWGKEGVYQATFYPTVATTFGYHLTGTIEGNPVDLTFTCTPGGEKAKDEDTEKEIAPGVTQISLGGSFNCPVAKESLGFPEDSASLASLAEKTGSSSAKGTLAIVLAVAALGLSAVAFRRRK